MKSKKAEMYSIRKPDPTAWVSLHRLPQDFHPEKVSGHSDFVDILRIANHIVGTPDDLTVDSLPWE